ncbi:MAG: hypothetical protein A2Y40_02155 [Candidatus Margulisbacteria bacterium GWF2_35_9]|nr:MAG: hypothetical protein A2Y40_02155 [Candidatus Margulisbacteria bacterium GWF2_35_9]
MQINTSKPAMMTVPLEVNKQETTKMCMLPKTESAPVCQKETASILSSQLAYLDPLTIDNTTGTTVTETDKHKNEPDPIIERLVSNLVVHNADPKLLIKFYNSLNSEGYKDMDPTSELRDLLQTKIMALTGEPTADILK